MDYCSNNNVSKIEFHSSSVVVRQFFFPARGTSRCILDHLPLYVNGHVSSRHFWCRHPEQDHELFPVSFLTHQSDCNSVLRDSGGSESVSNDSINSVFHLITFFSISSQRHGILEFSFMFTKEKRHILFVLQFEKRI